jgi:[protein-PII] uridylyltransferase
MPPESSPASTALQAGRERVRIRLTQDPAFADEASSALSALVDGALHQQLRELRWEGALVLALGGSGRRTLCLHSDVDVLVLLPSPPTALDGDRLRALLDPLWAAGLRAAPRVDDVAGVLQACDTDLTMLTALLDARPIAGDAERWRVLQDALTVRREFDAERVLRGAVRDARERRERHGTLPAVLEPHMKEGPGGLRDLQWIVWAGQARWGVTGFDALWAVGALTDREHRQLVEAARALTRTRHMVHLLAGRAQERLAFELQQDVATALHHRDRGGERAVSHFLRSWYEAAALVDRLLRLLLWRWTGTDVSGDRPPGVRRPETVKEVLLVLDALQGGSPPLDPEEEDHLRQWVVHDRGRLRRHRGAAAWMREFLGREQVGRTLFVLHAVGLLGALVPEFEGCRWQAQYSRFHRFTVDVHLLRTVEHLEALPGDKLCGPAGAAVARTRSPAALRLAALLHDVAKRHGTAHSRVGAEVAERVMRRLGFPDGDIERVRWLVLHHLLLSDTAYHRDLPDPHTRRELRAVIPDAGHADDLLALTWADARATNEEQWTAWRQAMVEGAWRAALQAIGGTDEPPPLEALRAQVEALLLPEVGHKRAGALAERVFALGSQSGEEVGARDDASGVALAAILVDRLEREKDLPCATWTRHRPGEGWSEWTAATRDRQGVFRDLAGTLTACGFAIVSATVRTWGPFAVDTFMVTDPQGRLTEEASRWRRLERTLPRVLSGDDDLRALVELARRHAPKERSPGQLDQRWTRVSNSISEQASVVEAVVPDRIGLLYDLCTVLLNHDLGVRVAKIATRHDLASDTLYVVDRRGRKLSEPRRRRLEAALRQLEGPALAR